MPRLTSSKTVSGFFMAISSAIFWGISGTCAQYLFEQKQLNPAWLVSWRLMLAGVLLVGIAFLQKNSDATAIWKKPKDILQLLIFAVVGMVTVQYTYFYSIDLSNAATATVLQYTGPMFVVAFYAIKNRRWPIMVEYASLFLAIGGTFLLVTHGSFSSLVISEQALLWGFLSAVALAFYTIYPVVLLRKYSAATVTGWAMLIGGLVLSVWTQPWEVIGVWDIGTWSAFLYIILFGTLIAFYSFLTAVPVIGAQTASLLCSVEPLAAAAVAVIWLNVPFGGLDWLGTLFILITVVLLTLGAKKENQQATKTRNAESGQPYS